MTLIKISDLTTTDINLSAGSDSFLNELKKAETTQIVGGWRGGSWKKNSGWKKDSGWKKEEECDYSYKEKCDYRSYYKEERSYKSDRGWKKDC